ncbi:immunoglobulin superfamily member 2 isoform X1 [Danio rerio]|uniref:immunoglobulin superfamily member 2 isoform X1 n=2 Tax=Danio rerio TaxID=7955 RepID=UPI0001E8FFB4
MEDFVSGRLLLLLLLCLLQWDQCDGQRVVQIQDGPLYRVEGFPFSIFCSVSGFKGSSEQDFEFGVKKKKGEFNIISTKEPDFAFARFSDRVKQKEIEIERMTGSSALLRIKKAMMDDAGQIFCHTPSTDPRLFGVYEAETTLNVVPDTLKAIYSGSPTQSLFESDPLQLECQVYSETFQHTHLSVTWYVHSAEDEDPRPVITLDRDLTVKPGGGFEDRYHAGLISMDKVEDTTYRLKMPQVQQSDQGKFYCKTVQWIQDPDRNWTEIAHKTSTACDVEIKPIEAQDVGSFSVSTKASKGPLQERDALDIRCSVKAQNLPGYFYSVTWMKNGKNVAQIGPSGMLTVFDSYKDRENSAEMRAVKTSLTDYLLSIHSARTEDQGQYQCEVWQESMNEDGTFKRVQKQLSNPETVNITTKESDLAVVMMMKDAVTEGDALQVTCSVSGFKGSLSVSWQHKKDSVDSFSDVTSLTHEGVMKDTGKRYQSRHVQTLHSPAGNFTLEIGEAGLSDSGEYRCIVSEWIIQSNGEMKKTHTQSQQNKVAVRSVESLMKVTLISREITAPIDSPVKLLCIVERPEVSLAVRWMFRSFNSTAQKDILTIHNAGEITWLTDQRNYQLSVQEQPSSTIFTLIMPRASKRQEGQYQCQVDAYQRGRQKAIKNSNLLAVTIQKPDSKLRLSTLKSRQETTANTDAKIECSILKKTTNSSRFTITWMIGSQMLLNMDLDAVVKYGPAAGVEMDQRIRMTVRQKHTFQLTVHQARTTDSGQYLCEVEEWLQDPLGDWYSLKKLSASTELIVKEKASDFRMNKADTELNVKEGEPLMLNCSVDGSGSDSTLRYSLTWFFTQDQSASVTLLTYFYDGRLIYSSYDPELAGRLHFFSPAVGIFQLTIHRAIQTDRGRYHCQAQQYQVDCKGHWSAKASDKSGYTNVAVQLIENKLSVRKEDQSRSVTNLQEGFTIDCIIDSRSSDASVFEVTWSKGLENERPIIIFNASRDGTLHSAINDKDLVFKRPGAKQYMLTVPNTNLADSGLYHCQVVEWIQTAANKWRRIGEDKSGQLSIQVKTEESQKKENFTMDNTDKSITIKHGEKFELECTLSVKTKDPSHHYNLRWIFNSPDSSSGTVLLVYSYNGHLQYGTGNQQLKDRLRFSRPTTNTFHLTVRNAGIADAGSYQCRVEMFQLDCEGRWTQTAQSQSGLTTVTVHSIESNLRVQKENQTLNITNLQAGFTADCIIASQSSDKSAFQVTWFKVEEEVTHVIFTAKHDGTLHSALNDKYLVFGRPDATHYKLTVPQTDPTDKGKYYCQVEEWLHTDNTWKRLASDRSGVLSVHVHIKDDPEKQSADPLGVTMGITVPLICFLVLVIVLLLRREHKRNCELKKKKDCLWAENNPLSPVPGDSSCADNHT